MSDFLYGWIERADRVDGGWFIAEDECGRLLLPSKERKDWWGPREFNRRNPTHWPIWLHSRLHNKLVWVESE